MEEGNLAGLFNPEKMDFLEAAIGNRTPHTHNVPLPLSSCSKTELQFLCKKGIEKDFSTQTKWIS
eukprot:5534918-Amphidinium_carterae.1